MRVQLVDPSAFTPPYDRALAAALARGGAEVELVTTKFLYGPVPEADGYEVDERFYKRSAARGLGSSARLPFKGAEHLFQQYGTSVVILDDAECVRIMREFIDAHADLWNEDIGK